MIFYFHGFASSENSWKIGELKKHLPGRTVMGPTLPVNKKKGQASNPFDRTGMKPLRPVNPQTNTVGWANEQLNELTNVQAHPSCQNTCLRPPKTVLLQVTGAGYKLQVKRMSFGQI